MENPWENGIDILSHLENCNYNHYCLQQNIYKIILEKFYDIEVSQMLLVQLHPNLEKYNVFEVKDMEKEALDLLTSAGGDR